MFGYAGVREHVLELEEENKRLNVDVIRTRYLARMLEIGQNTKNEKVDIIPVLENNSSQNDALIISSGTNNAIHEGDMVYHAGFIVGVIATADESTANVQLFSGAGQETTGLLFPAEEQVTIEGRGNGNFFASLSRDIPVEVGDQVFVFDEQRSLLAIVRDVQFDPRDPFQSVYLSYPENTGKFNYLEIKNTLSE